MNPVVLITGASRGIGRATALAAASDGYDVAINFVQDLPAAESVASDIVSQGRRAMVHRADVGNPVQVEHMVAEVERRLGPIDAVVNNAGIVRRRDTARTTLADWDESVNTNLTATFVCIKAVLPSMMARQRGAIVNVASIAGINGGSAGPHYAAAKGGVIALTRYLARDLASHGIRVNAVAPTFTDTDMLKDFGSTLEAVLAARPMKRLIRPNEVADVIVFLLGERASYVSGDCIEITGGN